MKKQNILRKLIAGALALTCAFSCGAMALAAELPDSNSASVASVEEDYGIWPVRFNNYFHFRWNIDTRGQTPAKYTGYLINVTQDTRKYFTVTEPYLEDLIPTNTTDEYWVAVMALDADGNQIGYAEKHFTDFSEYFYVG